MVIDLFSRYSKALGVIAANTLPRAGVLNNLYRFERTENKNAHFERVSFAIAQEDLQAKIVFCALPFISSKRREDALSSVIAPPMMIHFGREKDLVKTKINASDHIVVERWGVKPWNLKMEGILIDIQNRSYPKDKVKALYRFFSHDYPVEVTGDQFEDKDIRAICFEQIDFQGVEGFADTLKFSLSAFSLSPANFTLNQPDKS